MLVTSDPVSEDGAEAFLEQSPENQAATSPSLGEAETEENTLGDDTANHVNEIITPTDLLPHDPVVAQPTLDNFVKDVLSQHPQSVRDETGETNELVDDPARTTGETKLTVNCSSQRKMWMDFKLKCTIVLKCNFRTGYK